MWRVIAVAFGIWMSVFMSWDKYPYLTPTDADMTLPADEFIAKFDGILYEPLFISEFTYWIWVVGCVLCGARTYACAFGNSGQECIY